MPGGHLLVVGLAFLTVFLGLYGEVHSAFQMKTVKEAAAKTFQDMASADGLQVTATQSSWDPATGDLIVIATIENLGDAEKKIWYLVAEGKDESGAVVATAKMLTGRQIYSQRDYEIMGRRGMDVQSVRLEHLRRKETPLPAHGTMDVELRMLEPPGGIATYEASFRPFDPLKMLREQMEEASKRQEQSAGQQGQ
jgi:hypothetical protein